MFTISALCENIAIFSIILSCAMHIQTAHANLFDSTASLSTLIKNREWLALKMKEYIVKEEERIQRLKSRIDIITSFPEDADILNTLGHPVNAFNIISDWNNLSKLSVQNTMSDVIEAARRDGIKLPNQNDYRGALQALIRLQKTYKITTDDLTNGMVFNRTAHNTIDVEHFLELAEVALPIDHGLAMSWLEKCLKVGISDTDSVRRIYTHMKEIYEKAGDYERAWITAHKLLEIDSDNAKLVNDMHNYKRYIEIQRKEGTLSIQKFYWKDETQRSLEVYESLCRGEVQTPSARNLVCVLRPGILPYITYKEEIHSFSPRISLFLDVISDKQANYLKESAFPGLYRAQVGDPTQNLVSDQRVGQLNWLWDADPVVHRLSLKVADITGLSTAYSEKYAHSEAFQIVNYGIGGQYEPHYDFYEQEDMLEKLPSFIHGTGDRIATFMFYLSDVLAGGATVFPNIGVRIPPIRNGAAFWYNFDLAGQKGDTRTLHAGCPVLLGQKWIGNKWIRQAGQEFRRRCSLAADDIDPLIYA